MGAGSTEAAGKPQGKSDRLLSDLKNVLSGGQAKQPDYLAQLDKQSTQPPPAPKAEPGRGVVV